MGNRHGPTASVVTASLVSLQPHPGHMGEPRQNFCRHAVLSKENGELQKISLPPPQESTCTSKWFASSIVASAPPAFFAADTIVGQRLHPSLIVGNSRQKRADFEFFGSIKSTRGLIECVFHAATLPTLLEFHTASDFIERPCGLGRQPFQNVSNLAHALVQSCFTFFQLPEAEDATPIFTNGQAPFRNKSTISTPQTAWRQTLFGKWFLG